MNLARYGCIVVRSVLRSCVMNTTQRLQSRSGSRAILLAVLACVVGLLGGCNKAIAPKFEAVGVRQLTNTDERSTIEFSIEATNPNKEPIPLKQISYRVEIDGVEVFAGVRSPETTLHTYSSHIFKLPAVLPMASISGSGEVEYRLIGTVEYIPPGRLAEVLFDAKVKVPEAPLDLSGTINLN